MQVVCALSSALLQLDRQLGVLRFAWSRAQSRLHASIFFFTLRRSSKVPGKMDCPNLVFPRFQSELAITVYKVSIATPLVLLTGKKMKHIILSDQLSGARTEHVIRRSPAP